MIFSKYREWEIALDEGRVCVYGKKEERRSKLNSNSKIYREHPQINSIHTYLTQRLNENSLPPFFIHPFIYTHTQPY